MPINSLTIISGSVISQTTVDSGGTLFLEGDATAKGTVVNSGGDLYAALATTTGTIVNSGGREDLTSDSFALGTVVLAGGLEDIYDDGHANDGVIYGNTYVYDHGDTQGAVVNGGGAQYVEDYAEADFTVVSHGGVQYVEDLGVVDGTVLSGGTLSVAYNGLAEVTTVMSGGTEIVSAGATAASTTVSSGGTLDVLPGSTAINFALFSGGTISNAGTLLANMGPSLIDGVVVVGNGTTLIGNGLLDIREASSLSLAFQPGGVGGLQLDVASAYTGKVTGFGSNSLQFIDFSHINSAGAIVTYTSNSTSSGVLKVTSGGHTLASINMLGQYTTADFHPSNDGGGHLEITDPPVVEQQTGNTPSTIAANTVLEVKVPDKGEVTFAAPTGTLWLDHPGTFTGKVADFGAQDSIDLPGIPFGAHTTLGYSENSTHTGGILSVKNGTHVAKVALLGNYIAGGFVTAADGHGGTLVTETVETASQQPLLARPHTG